MPAILFPLLSVFISDRPSPLYLAISISPPFALQTWAIGNQAINLVQRSAPRYLDNSVLITCTLGFFCIRATVLQVPPTTCCTFTCTPGSSTLTVPHANARVRLQRKSSTSRCDLADVDPSTSPASYAIHCQRRLSRAHDAHLTFYKPSSSPNLLACQ
ncbi:hypothetical protein QBC32DRAFT_116980 [Pseudoneurospora amorphoporcata]|uniref:Uncharacterized protein n=1 Tax=Pseudoneurospora amorphoporcata TaxID=241081 RepID=A0AAN6SGH6_9PEZI|nr:hypothetical protein QBC32DRAFT_116980 [Pseudoneurospora amorphoporcata]